MTSVLQCCAPVSLVENCQKEVINKTELFSMIKMNCTFSQCDQSGFLTPHCFKDLEDRLVKFMKSNPFTNNHKKETYRRYNFDFQHNRDFLWKEKGIYGMVYKQITCNCGKGFLKKDLAWPPANFRRQRKKITSEPSLPDLPKLQVTPASGGIRYIPSYVSDCPKLDDDPQEEASASIPGAKFADGKSVKRGEVIVWDGFNGQIRNISNPEERICVFTTDVCFGCVDSLDIGCEVEYQTVKKNKKMEAIRYSGN